MKATKLGQAVSVVMLGASGAVGGQVVSALLKSPGVSRLTLLGRKPVPGITGPALEQHTVDALSAASEPKVPRAPFVLRRRPKRPGVRR